MSTPKEYEMRVVAPGRRWRIVHRTPDAKDGVVERVYYVSRGTFGYGCSCPAGRYGKPCKHARFVAALHARPADAIDRQPPRTAAEVMGWGPDAPAELPVCGYCAGQGAVQTLPYNVLGYAVPVRVIECDYCAGTGCCEGGDRLLPAETAAERLERSGLTEADHEADLRRR